MTRTCFVHIGMHKSGSTAIQTAFDGYDDGRTRMLRVGQPNHSLYMLLLFASAQMRKDAGRRIGVEPANLDTQAQILRESIVAQFQSCDANFIVSGEELSASLTGDEVKDVQAFLQPWFDNIQIIIYLRDPATYLRSIFQEQLKHSMVAFDFDLFLPNYRKLTVDWINVFGRDNVSVVAFDRKSFDQGSVIHDFANRVGADLMRLGPQVGNESLRAEGFALTYAIRNTLARGRPTLIERVRLRADLYMLPKYGQRKFDFSGDNFRRALERQQADVGWAESLMQRPFPMPEPVADAVVFTSHDDIMQYARQTRAGFDQWKRTRLTRIRRLRYLVRVLRGRRK